MNAPLTLVPRSSLGNKYLMAVTGLGLTGFVLVHMLGNLQVFLGPEALNAYAQALKHNPVLLWGARLGLLAVFTLHIVLGVRLALSNRAARPVPYAMKRYAEASVASRTMLLTGLATLAFVVFHLAHYTLGVVETAPVRSTPGGAPVATGYLDLKENPDPKDPKYRHDVYRMTVYGFRNPAVSASYVIAMALLAVHLSHGFQSLWQSLGLNHPVWAPLLKRASFWLAVAVFVGNSSMPLAVLLGLVGKDVP